MYFYLEKTTELSLTMLAANVSNLVMNLQKHVYTRASDISRKKSKILRDFQGQIRGKIGRFRGIFAGEKSKFAKK